jgi:hypothetical protein
MELFESFAGFFSHEECYLSLKSCEDSVEDAARWLVDEGEKDREKKALSSLRKVLIAESELQSSGPLQNQPILQKTSEDSMPPPPISGKKGGDTEVIIKEG